MIKIKSMITIALHIADKLNHNCSSGATMAHLLEEVISLFAKNPRVLYSLLLISFLAGPLFSYPFEPYTFSLSASNFADLATTNPRSPAYSELLAALLRDTKELLSVKSAITYTLTAVNICAFAAAQAGQQQETLREVLHDAKPSLAGALLTQLLVAVLSLGYIIVEEMEAMTSYYLSDRSAWWLTLVAWLSFAASVWFMYLMVIFQLSEVVSVVEQGTRGWKAISRAAELIQRSKWQDVGIVVSLSVVGLAVGMTEVAATSSLHLGQWGKLCVGWGSVVATEVVSFVELGAFVVLHSRCVALRRGRRGREARLRRQLAPADI